MNDEDDFQKLNFEKRLMQIAEIPEKSNTIVTIIKDYKTGKILVRKIVNFSILLKDPNVDLKELQNNDHEYKIYKKVRRLKFMPRIYWRGPYEKGLCTIEEQLGPSLLYIFDNFLDKEFSQMTIALIAIRMLNNLRKLHTSGVTHNNIQPSKILIGKHLSDKNLYLVGLGNCRKLVKYDKYINSMQKAKRLVKPNLFSSVNIHLEMYPTRKDDIESLGYVLLYFFRKGQYVWEKVDFSQKKLEKESEIIDDVKKEKNPVNPEMLCANLPEQMNKYFTYVQRMKNLEKPDYNLLIGYMKEMVKSNAAISGHLSATDIRYDWITKAVKKRGKELSLLEESKNRSSIPFDMDEGGFGLSHSPNYSESEDDEYIADLDETYSSEIACKEGCYFTLELMISRLNQPTKYNTLMNIKQQFIEKKIEKNSD